MIRLAWLAITGVSLCLAGSPEISELKPRGAEIGKAFRLTVIGKDIPEGASVASAMPASFTPVTAPAGLGRMQPGRSATFLVELKQDAAPGVYPIRLTGPTGISNVLLFSIGTFPEQTEEESSQYAPPNGNDTIESAQPVQTTPVTVNGTLRGAERDLYRVYGKAGERRVFEVEARRSGSAIDPVLRILDGSGKQLARSEDATGTGLDARLEFAFPREGNYYVEVHDARFSTQVQNFYRLKMGSYPFADGIFPLGGKRGDSVEVSLLGGNLPKASKTTIVPGPGEFDRLPVPGSASQPFLFATSDLPELMEPAGVLQAPSVVNGRLAEAGEVDRYKIAVQPGEKLLLDVEARELGTSRVEAVLTVYGPDGKKLDSAGDKPLPEDVFAVQASSRTSSDPFLNVTVPDGVQELQVSIEDLAQRGGPHYGYRLIVRRQPEDFTLTLGTPDVNIPAGGSAEIPVIANRRGYLGSIQLTVPDLPKGITVEGGYIPQEKGDANNVRTLSRKGVLVLTAEPGIEANMRDLVVYGEAKLADGTPIRRRARGLGMMIPVAGATAQGVVDRQRPLTAPWLGMDLPASLAPPPAGTLEVKQLQVTRLEEGDRYEFEYRWKLRSREARPKGNLAVEITGARDIRITDMKRAPGDMKEGLITGTFVVNTSKATEPTRYDMIVRGRLQSEGGEEEIVARPLEFIVAERSSGTNVPVSSSR